MFNFGPKVPQINVEEVKQAIDEKLPIVILDVRTQQEYSRGKIPGSINVSIEEVGKNIENVIPDKNKKVYVYCLSGSRSIMAVDIMQQLGYSDVYSVVSGLLAWRAKQYPLEN